MKITILIKYTICFRKQIFREKHLFSDETFLGLVYIKTLPSKFLKGDLLIYEEEQLIKDETQKKHNSGCNLSLNFIQTYITSVPNSKVAYLENDVKLNLIISELFWIILQEQPKQNKTRRSLVTSVGQREPEHRLNMLHAVFKPDWAPQPIKMHVKLECTGASTYES